MKKMIFILGAIIALTACSKEVAKTTLTVNTEGISDASIRVTVPGTDSVLAKSELLSNLSQFDLNISHPQLISVEIEGVQSPIVFFADLNEMTVDINGVVNPPKFKVTGSAYNDSLEAFGSAQNENREFMRMISTEWEKSMQANDSLTLFVINVKADSAFKAFEAYTKDFAVRNDILGVMIAQQFIYDADYDDLISIYENIPVRYKNVKSVVEFKERMNIVENTQIGKRFTDITQNDSTGMPFSISEIEGKYILIDFWASWCGPCRRANPELVKIYNEYHHRGFEIVGVSLDQKASAWKKAIKDDQLTWPQMSDLKGWANEGSTAYAIRSIPQSVLIDNQGFIINKNLDPHQLKAFLSDNL